MGIRRKGNTEGDDGEERAPQGADLDLDAYFAKVRTDTARAERTVHRKKGATSSPTLPVFKTIGEAAGKAYGLARGKIHALRVLRASTREATTRPQLPPDLVAIVLLSLLLVVAGIFFKP